VCHEEWYQTSSIYIAQSLLIDRRITTQSLSMRIFAHIQNICIPTPFQSTRRYSWIRQASITLFLRSHESLPNVKFFRLQSKRVQRSTRFRTHGTRFDQRVGTALCPPRSTGLKRVSRCRWYQISPRRSNH
jgi:hypothetical protein